MVRDLTISIYKTVLDISIFRCPIFNGKILQKFFFGLLISKYEKRCQVVPITTGQKNVLIKYLSNYFRGHTRRVFYCFILETNALLDCKTLSAVQKKTDHL